MAQKSKEIKKVKIKFEAKKGSRISDTQAELYGRRIYDLMTKKGKTTISPKEVLQDAKKDSSPYHNYFTWNNDEAGEKYRIDEARHLLNSIVIVKVRTTEEEPIQVRAFVNVIDEEGEKGYVPIDVAISTPKTASQIIQQALKEAKSWRERYLEYQELSRIHRAISEELEEFTLED